MPLDFGRIPQDEWVGYLFMTGDDGLEREPLTFGRVLSIKPQYFEGVNYRNVYKGLENGVRANKLKRDSFGSLIDEDKIPELLVLSEESGTLMNIIRLLKKYYPTEIQPTPLEIQEK